MPLPKRLYLDNYPYFLIINTYNRIPVFISEACCQILVKNLAFYRKKFHFKLYGFCLIPRHLLLIILPKMGEEISRIIADFKNHTRKEIINLIKSNSLIDFRKPCGKGCFCELYLSSSRSGGALSPPQPSRQGSMATRAGGKLKTLLEIQTIWQSRFYDHVIRNQKDLIEKLDYIHKNPIKHGLIENLDDYKWSSYQNYYLDNSIIEIDKIDL